jgi:hypothetical protein
VTYDPKPGDIGLTQIRGGVGLGIRLGQWANGDGFADFEHAFGYTGGGKIIEAEPGGARLSLLSRYAGDTVHWLVCPDEYREAMVRELTVLKGTPYSFLDYASLALHRLHVPAPHLRQYIQSSGHLICSQLVDRAAMRAGWHLFTDNRWEGDVTPGDLQVIWMQQHGAVSQV